MSSFNLGLLIGSISTLILLYFIEKTYIKATNKCIRCNKEGGRDDK